MGTLRAILGEIIGLFVDDGSLAIALVLWIAAVRAAVSMVSGLPAAVSGAALVGGCIAILLWNVAGAARARAGNSQTPQN